MLQFGMMSLICPMDPILFLIYNICLNISSKKKNMKLLQIIPYIQISVNKRKNRIVFKIKTGYKLELSTEETMQF